VCVPFVCRFNAEGFAYLVIIIIIIITAIEFSLDGSSFNTSADKTNKNKYT